MKLLPSFRSSRPKRAQRVEPVVTLPARRSRSRTAYAAAEITNLTHGWTAANQPPATSVREGFGRLRARVREQARNNGHVRRALSLYRSNVIGPEGIRLQAQAVNADGTPDTTARAAIEAAWRRWSMPGACDVSGRHGWLDLQNLAVNSLLIDGELLWLHHESWSRNAFGYAIQVLDPAILDHEYNHDLGNGRVIRMGVEYDRFGAPVAYHLLDHDHSREDYQTGSRKRIRVLAGRVTYLQMTDFAFQGRGVSPFAAALLELRGLGEYREAELTAARASARKMGFFTEGPDGEKFVGDADDSGEEDIDDAPIMDIEESGFGRLPHGVEFQSWDPQHPNSVFPEFVRAGVQTVGAALDVPYHALANDPKAANFSSLRAVAVEFRPLWRAFQNRLRDHVHADVFERWLQAALLREQIEVGGRPLPIDRIAKFRNVSWRARGWEHVQPREQTESDLRQVAARMKSISAVIRDRGEDPDAVFSELRDDFVKLEALGISPQEVGTDAPGNPDDGDEEAADAE